MKSSYRSITLFSGISIVSISTISEEGTDYYKVDGNYYDLCKEWLIDSVWTLNIVLV